LTSSSITNMRMQLLHRSAIYTPDINKA